MAIIDKPSDYFSTNLWVADDASSRVLTGFGHTPAMVWHKHRGSGSINPTITDSVRGGDKQLATATNAAEDSGSHGKISAFGTDGITVIDGTSGSYPKLYFNDLNPFGASVGGNYVGWSWSTGTSFTNDASATGIGSIDSTGSVNTDAGFSVISYTGTGANATVAHGLGSVPKMIIMKNRSISAPWQIYHESLGNTHHMIFTTSAKLDDAGAFNDTSPTSSVFSLGASNYGNGNGNTQIAYCFAEKQSYSKFSSYIGNGQASDGPMVFLGFRPAFVLTKKTDSADDWRIFDNKRSSSGFNPVDKHIYPYSSGAEASSTTDGNPDGFDFLSNGFKIRQASGGINASGGNYIYMAFAENPFTTSSGVPATAR